MRIEAFEFMLVNSKYEYHCDPWYKEPGAINYLSVKGLSGQIKYKNRIFVVSHSAGSNGIGGGFPASVNIILIKE